MASRTLLTLGVLAALVLLAPLSTPVAGQIYFSDNFEDPAVSTAQWEVISGDWQVADGVYHQLSTKDPWQTAMVAPDHWQNEWREYTVEFDVRPLSTGDTPVNVLFRVQEPVPRVWADRNKASTHLYRWIVNSNTNTLSKPYIYDGGTATLLAQTDNTMAVGTWHHLMLVVTKTGLAGYVNEVEMFNVQHAKWTDGRVGIQAFSGRMDFDNFLIYGPQYMPPRRLKARKPDPADGKVGVQMPLFTWSAGERAAFHDLYLGTTPQLGPAQLVSSRNPLTVFLYNATLTPGATYYWRVDEIESDGVTVQAGDLWSFVVQDVKAYYPTPADGSNTVGLTPKLTWMPPFAVAQHHLYFGDSNEAVRQGAAGVDQGMTPGTTFTPGTLTPLTTYFWRVDETVAGGAIQTGPVWSFSTFGLLEDFESYTDETDKEVFRTWIDGLSNGLSGSTAGNLDPPYLELAIVHGGKQALPLDYNNVKSPWYSEVEREWAAPQDWAGAGAGGLVLYFRGRMANSLAPLYAALEDGTGKRAVVLHANPSAVQAYAWTEWQILLSDFTGVDPAQVKKLCLGAGNPNAPTPGGSGRIYLDDIRLTKP